MERGESLNPGQGGVGAVRLESWHGVAREKWRRTWGLPYLETYASIGSTNSRLLALAGRGAPPGSVVIADEQTAGRGRRGRRWHSPPGAGISFSALVETVVGATTLPLLAGIAAARAIEAVAEGVGSVGLKWPNDLFLGGRKVGGILCEVVPGAFDPALVAVGVGINLRRPTAGFPSEIETTATTVEEVRGGMGRVRVDEPVAVEALVSELRALVGFAGTELPEALHREIAGIDMLRGCEVETEALGGCWAVGISKQGSLEVELADGRRRLVAGGSVHAVSGGDR